MSTLPAARAEADLVSPHGGALVDRIVPRTEAAALERRAMGLPSLSFDARELAGLELIAPGAAGPLTRFPGPADHAGLAPPPRPAGRPVRPLPLPPAVGPEGGAAPKPGG